VDSFIPHLPEVEHPIDKRFHGLFSKKEHYRGLGFSIETKVNSSALLNFPNKITWITSKDKETELCRLDYLK